MVRGLPEKCNVRGEMTLATWNPDLNEPWICCLLLPFHEPSWAVHLT